MQTAAANRLGVNQSDMSKVWRRGASVHPDYHELFAHEGPTCKETPPQCPLTCTPELLIRGGRIAYHEWGHAEWRIVLFTDETRITLQPESHRPRVWRCKGSCARLQHVQEVHAFHGGSVMFWAGIMLGWRTQLMPFDGTMKAQDHIEREWYKPSSKSQTLPECKACDVAGHELYRTCLGYVIHAIDQRPGPPMTHQEVIEAAVEEWNRLPRDDLDNLICGMPRRVRALLDVHGGHIVPV
ncbi:hypothetical protein PR048_008924 [Dryococelus australis]|uniref:Uncharacterized protein n=1 Tax=Dryococelus australis TaxID=614101 RepID=A0ABQ9HYG6_9NEOP|nr:hypothetical protein PR048_008924 [Dryococelus australis]